MSFSIESQGIQNAQESEIKRSGILLVLTGPSGGGKTVLSEEITQYYPNIQRIVTCTTREMRPGEINGVDYIFLPKDEFQLREQQEEFVETVRYGNNSYGTLKSSFTPITQGQNLLWVADMSRAAKINETLSVLEDSNNVTENAVVILIGVSNLYHLWTRYRKRGGDSESFTSRLRQDWDVWTNNVSNFPNIILSDKGSIPDEREIVVRIINATSPELQNILTPKANA